MNDSNSQTDRHSADEAPTEPPLRSVHTTNFPQILGELGASLLVTTYQAGKLVMLRADAGVLNTHFRSFNKPMGMAAGTLIVENAPAGAPPPSGGASDGLQSSPA